MSQRHRDRDITRYQRAESHYGPLGKLAFTGYRVTGRYVSHEGDREFVNTYKDLAEYFDDFCWMETVFTPREFYWEHKLSLRCYGNVVVSDLEGTILWDDAMEESLVA